MKINKWYIYLIIVALIGILIWQISSSTATFDQGYTGQNIISGDKWGINIVEIGEVERVGKAELVGEVSTIGTTLNFSTVLFNPGDKISFNVVVKNTSVLSAELYALTLVGINDIDSENITYSIIPIDGSVIHGTDTDGSIIKSGIKQTFKITVMYDETAKNNGEYHLNLGSTIIYKQK